MRLLNPRLRAAHTVPAALFVCASLYSNFGASLCNGLQVEKKVSKHGAFRLEKSAGEKIAGSKKKFLEIWCLSIAGIFSGYLAYYFLKMLIISYKFQERSEGADEILIWIPQISVSLGSAIFFTCVVHQLILKIFSKKNA